MCSHDRIVAGTRLEEAEVEEEEDEDDLHFSVCFRTRVSMRRANAASLY